MELVIIIVIALCVLAYYGFMGSLEIGANIANREVMHLDDVHMVSMIERTAKLDDKISDANIEKAAAVKAKLAAMRGNG